MSSAAHHHVVLEAGHELGGLRGTLSRSARVKQADVKLLSKFNISGVDMAKNSSLQFFI